MTNAYFYSNLAVQTSLSGSISNVALAITVTTTTGFPSSFPYVLALDFGGAAEELVTVTNAAGTTLTLGTRGFGGTSAQSHSLGAVVRHTYNAVDATDFRTHEASTGAVHGLTGAIVGTSDTQVLSNKTLTSPTITGTVAGSATYSTPNITAPVITGGGSWAGSPTLTTPAITTPVITAGGSWAGSPAITTPTVTDPLVTGIAAGDVPLVVRGVAAQTGNLTQWQNSATTPLSWIDNQGIPHWNNGMRVGGLDQLQVDVNGNLTTSGTMTAANFPGGVWTAYTPTWTGFTTFAPATTSGRYTVIGKLVHVKIVCTFVTGSVMGTGAIAVSRPGGLPANASAIPDIGMGMFGNAPSGFAPLITSFATTTTVNVFGYTTASNTYTGPGNVYNWQTGSFIQLGFTYETA